MSSELSWYNSSAMRVYRVLAYQDGDSFTGVCLDLGIVEEEHASLEEARLSIQEAVEAYLLTIREMADAGEEVEHLWYRPAPRKYWQVARRLTAQEKLQPRETPQLPPFLYSGLDLRDLPRAHA